MVRQAFRRHWPVLTVIAVLAGFHVATLLRTLAPFVDEAILASRAWAFIRTGLAFGELDRGVFDTYPGYWTYFPYLATLLQSLPLRVFGLSLFALRLLSLIFGLLLLVAVYAITSRLYGRTSGLMSTTLVGLSPTFLYSAHFGRTDIIAACAGFAGIGIYVWSPRPVSHWNTILCGLTLGLAFDIHPNAMMYAAPIVGLLLADYGFSVVRSLRFWAFAAALLVGPVSFVVLHVLPYPETYFAMTKILYGSSKNPPILSPFPTTWLGSIIGTLISFYLATGFWFPVIFTGAIAISRRRTPADQRLLIILLCPLATGAALLSTSLHYYAIHVATGGDLLCGVYVEKLWRDWSSVRSSPLTHTRFAHALLPTLVTCLLLLQVGLGLRDIQRDPEIDFARAVDLIRAMVPPDKAIIGSQTYWLGLPNQHYIGWEELTYYQDLYPGTTLADAFCFLKADYLLVDVHMEQFIVEDDQHLNVLGEHIRIRRAEMLQFIERHGLRVGTTNTLDYGNVQIYRLDRSCSSF